MNRTVKNINGYILAGGKSSRMGTDKGLMLLKGKAIVSHVIDQLSQVTDKVIIVSNNPAYNIFDCEVITDIIADAGPAGGIHAAMNHSKTAKFFVVSCDMPFIKQDAINFIISNSDNSQITIPLFHDRLQPLFGIYSKDCLNDWEILLKQGIFKLSELIAHFNIRKINDDNAEILNDLIFANINTVDDFENAEKL